MTRLPSLSLFSLFVLIACWVGVGVAQEMVIPAGVPPEQRAKMMEQMKAAQAGRPPGAKPGESPKKEDDKKKPEEGKKDDKKKPEEKKTTVTRPDKPKEPADPKELEARPEPDGKLLLNFRGHPWMAMIDWYSNASRREVEWRELPAGFVSLRTQRRYTMDETRDILNRLLLARGFTMLDDGEFLMVEKTEGINSALVPRVRPSELDKLMPHSFVRTSFRLQRVQAEEIVKELESMKSKNGKLTAMAGVNRIEAMDSARNLLDIFQAIDDEQSSGRHSPREFKLTHVRAEDVKGKLEEMLGTAKKQAAPMTPQQMQQQARMQQQQAQQNKGKPQPAQKKEEKISLVVNDVNNSIIVKAPPHRMLDIEETIEFLDIPSNRGGLDSYVDRVKTYRFATLNPEEVKNILMETAGLDPTTTIRVDKTSKSIIVDAPPWDHMVIAKLAKKLDGSARKFKVVRLRRLGALQVATTIEAMMGEPKEEDNNRSRYYGFYRYGQQEEEDKGDKFRVGADTENNRLLLKCNDTEYETVMSLLTQLGETAVGNRLENQVVLDLPGEDQDEFLRRVQEAFKSLAPNPVILPPPLPKEEKKDDEEKVEKEDENKVNPAVEVRNEESREDDSKVTRHEPRFRTAFTQLPLEEKRVAAAPDSDIGKRDNGPAPIRIERNSEGQLVIRSDDSAAVEAFEELMRRMAPRNQDWVHFKLKYVTAFWMKLQLEDFFKEEDEDGNRGRYIYFYEDYGGNKDKKPPGLSDQPKMRFIDDGESTLVVRNASQKQLATVRRLIELYDVKEPPNEQNARFKKMIHIKHSKARTIEKALKEAFIDLLSNKDKVFDERNKGGDKEGGGGSRRGGFFGGFDNESTTGIATSTFKGKISFGVDESSNILIVTTEGKQLLDVVVQMVEELDKAAVPSDDTRVITLPATLNSKNLRETLAKMFGPDAVTTKPGQEGQDPNQQQKEGQPQQKGRGRAQVAVEQ